MAAELQLAVLVIGQHSVVRVSCRWPGCASSLPYRPGRAGPEAGLAAERARLAAAVIPDAAQHRPIAGQELGIASRQYLTCGYVSLRRIGCAGLTPVRPYGAHGRTIPRQAG
jgi:hypothetical protein